MITNKKQLPSLFALLLALLVAVVADVVLGAGEADEAKKLDEVRDRIF